MKNNQFFAALHKDNDDTLVLGKVIISEDDEILLYSNDEEGHLGWNSFIFDGSKELDGFTNWTELDDDDDSDEMNMYNQYGLFGFTPLSKQRYETLTKSKKERVSLEKELQKKYLLGEALGQEVRKIDNQYVFGCGSVKLDKKTLTSLTAAAEKMVKTRDRVEEIDEEINKLAQERDGIDDNISAQWKKLNSAVDNQLQYESIYEDDFDETEIDNLKAILAK